MKISTKNKMCLICHTKLKGWSIVSGHQILVCPVCGLGVTENPNLQKVDYHRDEVYLKESRQFQNIFQRRANIINIFHPKPGKVLEIGSSTGLLLSILQKQGWEVLGIEISTQAALFAQKQGIPTLTVPIEKVKLSPNSFDVIVINHTLEHLQNPNQVIEQVHFLLKDKGIFLVDVPNFGSFFARVFKGSWSLLLPNEHLWHFTFSSLSKLLQNHGFEVLDRSSPSGIWDYGNPLQEVWQSLIGLKKRFFKNIITMGPSWVVSLLNVGTTLTVVSRKVK